jgi:hypothetical protein
VRVRVRCRVGGCGVAVATAAPRFAPTAGHPGFAPTAFTAECFYDFYLAVDEGAESWATGADHAYSEFELTVEADC